MRLRTRRTIFRSSSMLSALKHSWHRLCSRASCGCRPIANKDLITNEMTVVRTTQRSEAIRGWRQPV